MKFFDILVITQLSLAVVVFLFLIFINAPYGRYTRKGWGPTIPARFAWMTMEFPAFFVIGFLVIANAEKAGIFGILFLLMWEAHYIYRVWIYPFLLSSPQKPFPLVLVFFAICFNTLNGTINGGSLFSMGAWYMAHRWALDPRMIAGCTMFVAGFVIHAHSDTLLRHLQRGEYGEYVVPGGGMFRFMSSPNYFGEMVEWVGWAMATWSMAGLAFAVFTIANLLPRAVSNHRWYQKTFPEYPAGRKILIPFLW
jgi:3-oxo-5-alpha-steroid 4-dehydrogenase 1